MINTQYPRRRNDENGSIDCCFGLGDHGLAGFNTAYADKYADTIDVFKKADAVKPFFENCYGYAVFPTIGKGGIGIGGAYGTGQVYAQGVPTGTVKMFKGTIGLQFGGQAFSQMIFFEDKRAFDEFTGGNSNLTPVSRRWPSPPACRPKPAPGGHGRCQRRSGHRNPGQNQLPQGHGRVRSRQGRVDVRSYGRRPEVQLYAQQVSGGNGGQPLWHAAILDRSKDRTGQGHAVSVFELPFNHWRGTLTRSLANPITVDRNGGSGKARCAIKQIKRHRLSFGSRLGWLMTILLLALSVDASAADVAPGQRPAFPGEVWKGDFKAMAQRNRIRALVVYSKTFYFIDKGEQKGLTYEGLMLFQKFINAKLNKKTVKVNVIFIPVARDQLLPALLEGRGDIAAANLTITPERSKRVDFSDPFGTGVRELVVSGPASPEITSPRRPFRKRGPRQKIEQLLPEPPETQRTL
jgi:hypothetical protein